MKFSIVITIILPFIVQILSTSWKISEINRDSFKAHMDDIKYNDTKKLLLIFYDPNSTYCEEALNIIENDIIKEYNLNSGVEFGKITKDEINNIWLYLQFNVTRIPYIILIKGNYFYELVQKPNKYSIKELIDYGKDNSEKKPLPNEINTIRKISIFLELSVIFFRTFIYNIFGFRLNQNIIIFLFILIICSFLWLLKIIFFFIFSIICCRYFRNRKKNISNNQNNNNEIKEDQGESSYIINKIEKDIDKISSGLSDNGIEKNEKDDENNIPEINNNLFNEEMENDDIINNKKEKME